MYDKHFFHWAFKNCSVLRKSSERNIEYFWNRTLSQQWYLFKILGLIYAIIVLKAIVLSRRSLTSQNFQLIANNITKMKIAQKNTLTRRSNWLNTSFFTIFFNKTYCYFKNFDFVWPKDQTYSTHNSTLFDQWFDFGLTEAFARPSQSGRRTNRSVVYKPAEV